MFSVIRIAQGLLFGLACLYMTQVAALGPQVANGQALAQKRQCLACHQVQTRRVGPPFQAIADRFHGQPQAAEYLSRVIRQGSRGQWGAIPMPAQPQLSDTEARLLALWILSLADQGLDGSD